MTKPHSRLGAFDSSDFFFLTLIICVIVMLVVIAIGGHSEYTAKKQFYSSNGYVEVKYKGMDIWIKKTDIDLVVPAPEKLYLT